MADVKRGTVSWTGQRNFIGKSGSGFDVNMGSGEGAQGASPMELVLLALGGCSSVDIVSILEKQRQQLTGLEVQVQGTRRDEHPRIYTEITMRYIITGHNLDESAVARAIELTESKYCSVAGMIGKASKITSEYEIREAAPEAGAESA